MMQVIIGILILLSVCFSLRALRRPGYAFALVLSLYAFEQVLQQGSGFFRSSSSLLNLAFGGVTCVAILSTFLNRGMKVAFPPTAIYAYLLFLLAFVSLSWSVNTDVSLKWAQSFLPYALMFTFLVPLCITSQQDMRDAISASLFLGFFVALGMSMSTYGHRGIILDTVSGQDLEGNPLAAGNYGCLLYTSDAADE